MLYFILILIDQYCIFAHPEFRLLSKPLILLSLILLVGLYKGSKIWLFPLFFSFLGDIALIFEGPLFFILGLGSFLIAHLGYLWIFWQRLPAQYSLKQSIPLIIGLGFIGLMFLQAYWLRFGPLKIPVTLYVIVLSTMAWIGLRKYGTAGIGILLFVISDLMLGMATFGPLADVYWHMAIMMTYSFAQYFILAKSPQSIK